MLPCIFWGFSWPVLENSAHSMKPEMTSSVNKAFVHFACLNSWLPLDWINWWICCSSKKENIFIFFQNKYHSINNSWQMSTLHYCVHNLSPLSQYTGSLQNSLSRCPSILSMPRSRLLASAQCLKTQCQFSSQQVQKILNITPEALTKDPNHLEELFQVSVT